MKTQFVSGLCSLFFIYSTQVSAATIAPQYEHLSKQERQMIYNTKASNASNAAFKNLFPLALGSFEQEDILTGSIVSALDITAFGGLAYGVLNGEQSGGWSFVLGSAIFSVCYGLGRVLGLSVPWFYTPAYNARLRTELGLEPVSLSSTPYSTP